MHHHFCKYNSLYNTNTINVNDLLDLNELGDIAIALSVDAEYYNSNKCISIHVKHALYDDARLYLSKYYAGILGSKDIVIADRIFLKTNILEQYLNDCNYNVKCYTKNNRDVKRKCLLTIYTHEILKTLHAIFNYNINYLFTTNAIQYKNNRYKCKSVDTGLIIEINNISYSLRLRVIDTSRLCDNKKLIDIAKITNIELKHYDLLDEFKNNIETAYINNRDNYIKYQLGKLIYFDIVVSFNSLVDIIYTELDIPAKQHNKNTLGAVCREILEIKINNNLASNNKININENQSVYIKALSKTFGGRTINNNTTLININKTVMHIDIKNAYATAMQLIKIPIRNYILAGLVEHAEINHGIPLNKFLKLDLIERNWVAIISTNAMLNYDCDIFASLLNDETVDTKIVLREIRNAVLTSDVLDLINTTDDKTRNDFYSKIRVVALAYYPAKKGNKIIKNILPANWVIDGNNNFDVNNKKYVNLGEAAIDELLLLRNKTKDKHLNEFYKLTTNTIYGVITAKYVYKKNINLSNIILSNNINATVRVAIYTIEKALNMFCSVTDGGYFIPNFIKFNENKHRYLARLYRYSAAMLSSAKVISKFKQYYIFDEMFLMKKIRSDFNINLWSQSFIAFDNHGGKLKIGARLGVFKLQIKAIITNYTAHSVADSVSRTIKNELIYKCRGSSNAQYNGFDIKNNELIELDIYKNKSPHLLILDNIKNNKNKCPILPCGVTKNPVPYDEFIKKNMLGNQISLLNTTNIVVLVDYFALSQFKFNTIEQYQYWLKLKNRLKLHYGASFDVFFLNTDKETIDYERMIHVLDNLIITNNQNILDELGKHRTKGRYTGVFKNRLAVKNRLVEKTTAEHSKPILATET